MFAVLFIYLPSYLSQDTVKQLLSQAQAATFYQSNHSKVEIIPIKCLTALPKDTTSKLAGYHHNSLCNAECQEEKL